ncbi:MAG: sialate O-acetylesterase [Planctomycetia bacterium]|nr:sialate O-acetylesterase [Planctomycetia bacterium]
MPLTTTLLRVFRFQGIALVLFWTVSLASAEVVNHIQDGSFEGVETTYTIRSATYGYVIWGANQQLVENKASGNFDNVGFWKWKVSVDETGTNPTQSLGFYGRFDLSNDEQKNMFTSQPATDGTYAAFIQNFNNNGYGTASLEQTVNTLTPGKLYFVQYDYKARKNQTVNIASSIYSDSGSIALQNPASISNPGDTVLYQTYGGLFCATDSTMTFSIANKSSEVNDVSVFLDNVRLTAAAAQKASNLVRDGSFETGNYQTENGFYTIWSPNHKSGTGDFEKGSGIWQFSTEGTTSEFGVCPAGFYGRGTTSNAFALGQTIPDGTYVAGLQSYRATSETAPAVASISQTISGMDTGEYYGIAYHYNARPGNTAQLTSSLSDGTSTTTFQSGASVSPTTNFKQYSGVFKATSENATLTFSNTAAAGVDSSLTIDNVQMVQLPSTPIEAGMTPVHALDMTTAKTQSYNSTGVPYAYNASDSLSGKLFDKVGYYVELLDQNNQLQTLYITMDAFTTDASKIGVPANANASGYQAFNGTELTGVQVVSTVNGVSRTLNTGGKLEYWAGNYGQYLDNQYNGFDSMNGGNGFGSMQIHDATTGETLFSFSGWGSNGPNYATVGIGNSNNTFSGIPTTDWTGTGTIKNGTYAVANLYSFVHEADAVLSTNGTQLFQRDGSTGEATIAGTWEAISNETIAEIQISANGTDWTSVMINRDEKSYSGTLTLETGWHNVEIRALDASGDVLTSTFEKIGIGEIFITAGQSNAANYGGAAQYSRSGNVYEYDVNTGKWSLSVDPQSGATGTGGSTWPVMGDNLSEMLGGVPVGVISTAVGGSSILSWDPDGGGNYARLKAAIEAMDGRVAAILWHQGETDSAGNNSSVTPEQYQEALVELITATQGLTSTLSDSEVAWMVALVSYFNGMTDEELRAAQRGAVANTENTYLGPDSDALSSLLYRISDTNVHFNDYGLNVLGEQWAFLLGTQLYGLPEPTSWSLLLLGLAFLMRRNGKAGKA